MSDYRVEVETDRDLPGGMTTLLDAVCEELEKNGIREDEYRVEVFGPPEMSLRVVMR